MKSLFIALALSCQFSFAKPLEIVPAPQKWQPSEGQVLLKNRTITAAKEFKALAELFATELNKLTKQDFEAEGSLAFLNIFASSEAAFIFEMQADLAEEAYEIDIAESVVIKASSYKGAYYATRTLLQILEASDDLSLAKGKIVDSPKYKVRSMLLDVGRKFIPVEGLKDWIRMLGLVKMNELHLHLNDNSWGNYSAYRLESEIPGLSAKDGFYTWKEIRELQDFAKTHGVEIVPEIDSPGHALAFTQVRPDLAQKEMNRNGFGLAYLDLANRESIDFMKAIFDEITPHFDSPYMHIGTDEYRINLIKDHKRRVEYGEHFRKYINEMNAYIRTKHNKIVRIWSGYEHLPGTTEPDKSVVIDMWETSDAETKSKAGYQFVNSTHFYTYIVPGMPYYGVNNKFLYETWNPRVFRWDPTKPKHHSVLAENGAGLLGAKLHVWNDAGPTGYTWNEIARLTWPSLLVLAENVWGNKASKDYKAFAKRSKKITEVLAVDLMDRQTNTTEDGIVWSYKAEDKHFIANTNEPLNSTSKKADLEYPWTASFTLTRESETAGSDTLLSSDLATLYVDLEHKIRDKKTKKEVTKRGLTLVRAHQAPGYEP